MPVPNILAGTASGTTVQLDANFAYLAALRDLVAISSGNVTLSSGGFTAGGSTFAGYLAAVGGGSGASIDIRPNTVSGANGVVYNTSFVVGGNGPHIFQVGGVEVARFGGSGTVFFAGIGTTASAANAFLNSGSSPANQLLRSTSSLRYKTDVRDLPESYRAAVLALRPVVYKSTAAADDAALDHVGLIAEEVAEHAPRLVHYTRLTEGGPLVPDGVQYDRLAVVLLAEVQALRARVAALEAP